VVRNFKATPGNFVQPGQRIRPSTAGSFFGPEPESLPETIINVGGFARAWRQTPTPCDHAAQDLREGISVARVQVEQRPIGRVFKRGIDQVVKLPDRGRRTSEPSRLLPTPLEPGGCSVNAKIEKRRIVSINHSEKEVVIYSFYAPRGMPSRRLRRGTAIASPVTRSDAATANHPSAQNRHS
jgi:hypothetical protein